MRKFIPLFTLLLVLTGCSSKFAYNNLDWLVYWYIDDYIELNDPQEQVFDAKFTHWLAWHRSEELQNYAKQLQRIRQRVDQANISMEEIAPEFNAARQHWVRLREYVSPDLANMALLLSDEQVIYLFAELESQNKKREERRAELSEAERIERSIDDIEEQLEDLIGSLTEQQTALIRDNAPRFASTFVHWMSYRREIQSAARKLFVQRQNEAHFIESLSTLLRNPEQYRSAEHNALIESNRTLSLELIVKLHATLTAKQKRRLNDEIDGIIEDLEALMSDQ